MARCKQPFRERRGRSQKGPVIGPSVPPTNYATVPPRYEPAENSDQVEVRVAAFVCSGVRKRAFTEAIAKVSRPSTSERKILAGLGNPCLVTLTPSLRTSVYSLASAVLTRLLPWKLSGANASRLSFRSVSVQKIGGILRILRFPLGFWAAQTSMRHRGTACM